jgi:hypothetical protein
LPPASSEAVRVRIFNVFAGCVGWKVSQGDGVRCGAHQRKRLERLCRYITRPEIANERQLQRNSTVS